MMGHDTMIITTGNLIDADSYSMVIRDENGVTRMYAEWETEYPVYIAAMRTLAIAIAQFGTTGLNVVIHYSQA